MFLPSAAKQIKTRGERKRESHIFHTKSKKNKKKKGKPLLFSPCTNPDLLLTLSLSLSLSSLQN
jgi:hypothetical protein